MPQHRFPLRCCSLLLSAWLLMTCTAPEDKKPDNLINADQMANILTEVHLTETRVSRLSLRSSDSSNIVYKQLEANFLKKFGVDTASFRASYVFYSSHPREMEQIYKRVVDNLQNKSKVKKAKQI